MSDSDRANVRAMLMAARFPERDIEWMTASCPSVAHCKSLCKQPNRWWRQ
jgi:hypothetical protein